MPTYSDAQIRGRVSSGKDAERARKTDALFAKATQPPHDDDAQAMQQLQALAGDNSTGGFATNDARNYARMRLNSLGGPEMGYSEARDGGGFFGSVLGPLVRYGAPIAGALIPGVGMLGAAAIGGLGNAGGQYLDTGKVNLGEAGLAGAAGGFGNKLLGNGLGSGSTNWGFGSTAANAGLGNATQAGTTAGYQSTPPLDPGMSGNPQGGSWLDKILGGGNWLDKGLQIGGTIGAISSQRNANKAMDGAIQGATNEWNTRQPLRALSMDMIQNMGKVQAPDLTNVFSDPGNPYFDPKRHFAPTPRYG